MTRPTIADLAQAAGVGISTVDRVLNGRDPVRRATSERVLAAAERIGFYGAGAIRQRMSVDKPARTLGFVLQQRSTSVYSLLGTALADASKDAATIAGRPRIDFLEELTPDAVAERLLQVGKD